MQRALLFLNRYSRHGSTSAANAAVRQLGEGGMSLLQYSNYDRCDMASLIRSHAPEIDCVIVAGGDGSINAALEGLVATGLPLGILPFGTGNDFARTLGIPMEPAAAASLVMQGDTRSVDVGEINGHFFINVASIGLSVELTRYLTGTLKRRWGRLAYPIAAAKALAHTRPFKVRITGGDRSLDVRSLQVAIGNGVYYGAGMAVYDRARIDDQCLDFYCLEPAHLWRVPLSFAAFRRGSNRALSSVQAFCSPGPIEIHTEPALAVNMDGEITTTTPATVRLLSKALNVIAPIENPPTGDQRVAE